MVSLRHDEVRGEKESQNEKEEEAVALSVSISGVSLLQSETVKTEKEKHRSVLARSAEEFVPAVCDEPLAAATEREEKKKGAGQLNHFRNSSLLKDKEKDEEQEDFSSDGAQSWSWRGKAK